MTLIRRIRYVARRLGPYARPHRRWLVFGSLGTLFVVACRLAFPWPLRGVLELAFEQPGSTGVSDMVPPSGDPALWLGGAFVAIVLIQGLAELVQRLSFARYSIGLVHDARTAAVERLSEPQSPGGAARDPGDMIARVIGDSARVKSGLKGVLIRMTQNGVFFFGVLIVLFVIDWRLGLVFLAGGAVMTAIAIFGAVRVTTISRRLRRKEGVLAGRMHALLAGAGGSGDPEGIGSAERGSARAEAKTTKVEGLTIWGVHATLALTSCTIVLLGLQFVRAGTLQPADMFTVLFYLLMVHNPTVRLSRQTVRLGRVLASAERLAKVLKPGTAEAPEPEAPAQPSAPLAGVGGGSPYRVG